MPLFLLALVLGLTDIRLAQTDTDGTLFIIAAVLAFAAAVLSYRGV